MEHREATPRPVRRASERDALTTGGWAPSAQVRRPRDSQGASRRGLPRGLSPFSQEVFGVVAKYTVFAWPVLTAQCRRGKVDPINLDREALSKVAVLLGQGVAAFTTAVKVKQFEDELALLLRPT
jgi:hypothetical protein